MSKKKTHFCFASLQPNVKSLDFLRSLDLVCLDLLVVLQVGSTYNNLVYHVDDVRHDVYLTLDHGVFNKGTKRADKNVEIDMEIIDEKDQVISVRLQIEYISFCC